MNKPVIILIVIHITSDRAIFLQGYCKVFHYIEDSDIFGYRGKIMSKMFGILLARIIVPYKERLKFFFLLHKYAGNPESYRPSGLQNSRTS